MNIFRSDVFVVAEIIMKLFQTSFSGRNNFISVSDVVAK